LYSRLETRDIQKGNVFWDETLCRSEVQRRFGGTYLHHLQGRRVSQASNKRSEPRRDRHRLRTSPGETLGTRRGKQYYVPKRCSISTRLHGVGTHKIVFIITALRPQIQHRNVLYGHFTVTHTRFYSLYHPLGNPI
jgi:hypothetical protein